MGQTTNTGDAISSALRTQQYEKALQLSHAALRQSPYDPRLWMLQGVAYAGEGRRSEALDSFRAALKISPDYLPALQQQAQLEYAGGSMAAVPILQHILRLRPGDPTSHAMIAVLEYKNGNCPAAVVHFEGAGSLLDSQVAGLHAYATCLVRLKQFDRAVKVFARAVALRPDDPEERRLLASIQLMAHDSQAALVTLAPLLEASSPDAGTLELASSAYEEQHDTERAVSSLRKAILLEPQNVALYLEFAYISSLHSSFQVGVDVLSDGIGEQANSAQLYFARGVLYVNLAQYDKAEADFQRAYALDPEQELTVAAQGLLAVQQNDLDRALRDVRQKLEGRTNDPVLLYLQADVLAQKGVEPGTEDFATALHAAERAVALRPALAPARAVLAKLYLEAGENRQAVEQCRKALEIDPRDQTSLYRLIQALRKTGDTKELPDLLKRLAQLRQEATQEERQRNRFKLVEADNP
jgi:tetratricopeptide (TPR) repeat protein